MARAKNQPTMTEEPQDSQLRVLSAIPGRIRVQPGGAANGRTHRTLDALALRIAASPAIRSATVQSDARSVLVEYDAHQNMEEALDAVQRAAGGAAQTAGSEDAGRHPGGLAVQHSAPGRLRLNVPALQKRDDIADRVRDLLMRDPAIRDARSPAGKTTVIVRYDARRLDPEEALRRVEEAVAEVTARHAGGAELICAPDMPTGTPGKARALILPTIAVALAATEALPVAAIAAVLAAGAIPIAQRAGRGLQQRQVTVDEFDLANVVLLALQEQFLAASGAAWFMVLGDLLRSLTVDRAKRKLGEMEHSGEEGARAAEQIRGAPLSHTDAEERAERATSLTTLPLWAAGLAQLAITRNPGDFIGAVKPRYDFGSASRLGAPAPVLNAMIAAARIGFGFGSGEAMQRLAAVDTLVVDQSAFAGAMARSAGRGELYALLRLLSARGITSHLMLGSRGAPPTSLPPGVQLLRVSTPQEKAEALRRLRHDGRKVAVLADGARNAPGDSNAWAWADVKVWVRRGAEPVDTVADVVALDGDVRRLPQVVDLSQKAMRVLRQNLSIAATGSAFNLVTSLLGASPAPLASAVNAAIIAAEAANSQRPLTLPASRAQRAARGRRPVAATAVGTGA